MQVRKLIIQNYRGVRKGEIILANNTLLVGGNNAGKSTVCEALELVLGPERLYRRPVINEHDFYNGLYLRPEGVPIEIRIEAVLIDITENARLRFHNHLRRWDKIKDVFVDELGEDPGAGDAEGTCWALSLAFIGRYEAAEDDFIGNTFFAHPENQIDGEEGSEENLGAGLQTFTREHKRLCGFLFLRALRTGSRALTLQRGSLLDTILRLGGSGMDQMWKDTLDRLQGLKPPIGDIKQLKNIRTEVENRMRLFVGLSSSKEATGFLASDMTRNHLREVVRFFVASEQSEHLLPFQRLGTGSINMLVFSLLTFIADLKERGSVIFAMEEPEIALPPHTQRRVVQYLMHVMGQTIITSHSPYVIEKFNPEQITMLRRSKVGRLTGETIETKGVKEKTYRTERKQFAEAVLSRAVLVVEGGTEAVLFSVASSVLEFARGAENYAHFDMAGVTVFNARGDGLVPQYGPVFKALGKETFGFFDKQGAAPTEEALAKLGEYTAYWESPEKGIEDLLVIEMPAETQRRFLNSVKARPDYPTSCKLLAAGMSDREVKALTKSVLKARKGEAYGYAALLIGECKGEEELPALILEILHRIHETIVPESLKYEDRGPSVSEEGVDPAEGQIPSKREAGPN